MERGRARASVGGRGPRVGGLPDGVRPGQPRGAPGVVACQSPLIDWPLSDCFVLGVLQGPDNAGRVWLQVPDECLCIERRFVGLITQVESLFSLTLTLDD